MEFAIAAQKARKEMEAEKAAAEAKLAQLTQMAAVSMQAVTAMTSLTQQSPSDITARAPITPDQPAGSHTEKKAVTFGDKPKQGSQVSAKSDKEEILTAEQEIADAEKAMKAATDEETKAKLAKAIDDATKRKAAFIKKASLRKQLKDQLAKGGGKVGRNPASKNPDDPFSGELGQPLPEGAEADVASMADKPAGYQFFQSMKDGFSMNGENTSEEVGKIVAETEGELGPSDAQAGILGKESLTLFQRIKTILTNCARGKCVVGPAK